jgi:hypothetical protein
MFNKTTDTHISTSHFCLAPRNQQTNSKDDVPVLCHLSTPVTCARESVFVIISISTSTTYACHWIHRDSKDRCSSQFFPFLFFFFFFFFFVTSSSSASLYARAPHVTELNLIVVIKRTRDEKKQRQTNSQREEERERDARFYSFFLYSPPQAHIEQNARKIETKEKEKDEQKERQRTRTK